MITEDQLQLEDSLGNQRIPAKCQFLDEILLNSIAVLRYHQAHTDTFARVLHRRDYSSCEASFELLDVSINAGFSMTSSG